MCFKNFKKVSGGVVQIFRVFRGIPRYTRGDLGGKKWLSQLIYTPLYKGIPYLVR